MQGAGGEEVQLVHSTPARSMHKGQCLLRVLSARALEGLAVQVAGVIVGARNANHVADHQRVCGLTLDGEDQSAIQAVLDKGVAPTSDCYTWERGGKW